MAAAREALFELAVNRAAAVAGRLAIAPDDPARRGELEVWYLKTRFAYRVPFDAVLDALSLWPGGDVHWVGGPHGAWRPGPAPQA